MKRSKIALAAGIITVVFGSIFFVFGGLMLTPQAMHREDGQRSTGTITGRRTEQVRDREDQRTNEMVVVTYRFPVPGVGALEGEMRLPPEQTAELAPGQTVEVEYLANAPEKSRLVAYSSTAPAYLFGGIGALVAVIGLGVCWRELRAHRRIRRLMQEGLPAEAEVAAVLPAGVVINDVEQWRVHYQFKDIYGRWHKGESELMPPEVAAQWEKGEKGQIRCDQLLPTSSVWIGLPRTNEIENRA